MSLPAQAALDTPLQVIPPATAATVVMIVIRVLAVTLAGLLAALVGCRCPSSGCVPATPTAPCAFAPIEPTPTPDLSSLIPACEPSPCDFPCLLPGPTECYEALGAGTCQCHAATNATVANAVDIERHWASVLIGCEEGAVEESLCLTRSLLEIQAADVRNTAAASALTTFYLLAGVEAQEDTLQLGIDELGDTLRRLDQLKARNLPVPDRVDPGVLAANLADLEDKKLQLCLLRIQLNGQLKRLLGCPLDERSFFWPQVQWKPNLDPVDIEAEVRDGLPQRADIRSLQLVRCKLDKATVPVARLVLKVADATLGTVAPVGGLIHHLRCGDCKDHEVAVRCRQLSLLQADATQLAIAKIKSAAYKVAVQQDRVRLAKQAVDERRQELDSLEKRRRAEDISIFEISAARGRVFDAEGSLNEKVVELKVAEVTLKEVQGLLAVECGYDVTICCEHCCTGCCVRGSCGSCDNGCHADAGSACGLSVCGDAVCD